MGDSKFLFDFPSHQRKLQKAAFRWAWLSAGIMAASPGKRCLSCLGTLVVHTLDSCWWQGPSWQLLRGRVGSAPQQNLHGSWWDLQVGICMACWSMCQLGAKRGLRPHQLRARGGSHCLSLDFTPACLCDFWLFWQIPERWYTYTYTHTHIYIKNTYV